MNALNKNFPSFVFIPLILSIGIIPVFAETIDSPKKQLKDGVAAKDVVCKSGFELMTSPSARIACVKESSVEKLKDRNWSWIRNTTEIGNTTEVEDTSEIEQFTEDSKVVLESST